MTKQVINVGTTANDKKGDSLRAAFQKVNANFTELYTALGLAADVNLNLGNFVFTNNTLSLTNTNGDDSTATQIEIAQPVRVESSLTVGGDILPNGNLTSTIGSPTNKFHSIYVGTGSVYLGDARLSLEGGRISSSVGFDLTDSVGVVNGTVAWADVTGKPSILSGDNVIGYSTSETITQEEVGGTISQTTTNRSQVEIDANSIVITRNVTQVVNDGVSTATDEAGSVASIGNGTAYLKTYSEPDGPNNTQYAEVGTSGSFAYLESRQDDVGGFSLGSVVTSPGSVGITTHSTTDKTWTFDQDGNLTVPESSSIAGTNDFIIYSQSGDNSSGLFLNGNPLSGAAILYANNTAVIRSDNNGNVKDWNFDRLGTLTTPLLLPRSFTAVLDDAHMVDPIGFASEDPWWQFEVAFQVDPNGTVQTMMDQIFPILTNPGYVSGFTFRFTEADHGIPGFTFDITLNDVVLPGGAGWTANVAVTPAPAYPSTVTTSGAIKLTSNNNSWTFGTTGVLKLPVGGDIVDSTGTSVLGGSLGNLKIIGDTLATKDDPDTGGTGGFNLNLDPGGESNAFIQIPSVAGQTAGAQLSIGNNAVGNGGIRLSTAGGDYNFTDTQLILPSNNTIKQNNSWTRTVTPTIAFDLLGTVVWSSSTDYISGAKLVIQVECNEVGDNTGWHSQVCEAIISSRGFANGTNGFGDPAMTVYGVVHTSANVLVTFSVRRNATTRLIEVVGTLTAAAAGAADLRIHSVELSTRD